MLLPPVISEAPHTGPFVYAFMLSTGSPSLIHVVIIIKKAGKGKKRKIMEGIGSEKGGRREEKNGTKRQ